jgi:5-methylcytosine-specific restriction enzyme B
MGGTAKKISSDDVREYVEKRYIDDSRKKGVKRFTVNAGEVHRGLGLQNRVPLVCMALQSQRFLNRHGLKLVEKSGPASGLSTKLNLTFEFEGQEQSQEPQENPLLALRGILRDTFAKLGGGEKFIAAERRAWIEKERGGRR